MASRNSPLSPYSESTTIQSNCTFPAARVRRSISTAIWGFVWNLISLGTRVFLRLLRSAAQSSVRNNCASNPATPPGVTPVRNTPTWQFSVFPSRPHHCQGNADAFRARFLESRLVDHAYGPQRPLRGCGRQFFREDRLNLLEHVPDLPGRLREESLQRHDFVLRGRRAVRPARKLQRDRLDALPLLVRHQPFQIVQGVLLRFLPPEQAGKS